MGWTPVFQPKEPDPPWVLSSPIFPSRLPVGRRHFLCTLPTGLIPSYASTIDINQRNSQHYFQQPSLRCTNGAVVKEWLESDLEVMPTWREVVPQSQVDDSQSVRPDLAPSVLGCCLFCAFPFSFLFLFGYFFPSNTCLWYFSRSQSLLLYMLCATNLGTQNFLFRTSPRDVAHPGSGPAQDWLSLAQSRIPSEPFLEGCAATSATASTLAERAQNWSHI